MKNDIIKFIRNYQMSTADVADALGRKGHVAGIKALNRNHYRVGEVEYLYAWDGSIWYTHHDLSKIPEDRVVFVDSLHCGDSAVFGHLMTEYAFRRKSIAVVVNGNIRDVQRLSNWPVWHKGVSPIICAKGKTNNLPEVDKFRAEFQGHIMVCDDNGCVKIHPKDFTEETLVSLKNLVQKERDWETKLRQGLSTFEITCTP